MSYAFSICKLSFCKILNIEANIKLFFSSRCLLKPYNSQENKLFCGHSRCLPAGAPRNLFYWKKTWWHVCIAFNFSYSKLSLGWLECEANCYNKKQFIVIFLYVMLAESTMSPWILFRNFQLCYVVHSVYSGTSMGNFLELMCKFRSVSGPAINQGHQ